MTMKKKFYKTFWFDNNGVLYTVVGWFFSEDSKPDFTGEDQVQFTDTFAKAVELEYIY